MLTRSRHPDNPLRILSDVDRLFEALAPRGRAISFVDADATPPLDMWEDDANISLEIELPGIALDDVDLSVVNQVLTIKGARTLAIPENARMLRRERSDVSFERSITIPAGVDAAKVSAALTNGVLRITMPKAETSRPRRIEVKGS
jgi:HSP20 family protein